MTSTKRLGWAEYFMQIAHVVSARGTCDRKLVGCVIVRDKRILCTGYNGSVSGMPHCDDVGHDMLEGHCVRTNHAELNAVAQAAAHGIPIKDADVYINTFPCWPCARMLAGAGISTVYYDDEYRVDERVQVLFESKRIGLYGPDVWKRVEEPPVKGKQQFVAKVTLPDVPLAELFRLNPDDIKPNDAVPMASVTDRSGKLFMSLMVSRQLVARMGGKRIAYFNAFLGDFGASIELEDLVGTPRDW